MDNNHRSLDAVGRAQESGAGQVWRKVARPVVVEGALLNSVDSQTLNGIDSGEVQVDASVSDDLNVGIF